MLFRKVPTPCVGICSTTFGDTVCRGCRRYLHEVVDWNRYSEDEKRLVWQRLDGLLVQMLPGYFQITNASLLTAELKRLRISFRSESSAWAQLYVLLKATARQEPNLASFGVERLDLSSRPLGVLREHINAELHQLAIAYYDKDFLRARQALATPANLG